ncbi:hypothetical protein [Nostoc sp. ChiSLP03a]|nr:hypothetical protein [Nostoc sp. ChiSLP03a]MDZ8214365.1 hypothetical protein [Nostoc sp. ChiSLP03a]
MQHLGHFQKYSIYERTCGIWVKEAIAVIERRAKRFERGDGIR